MSNTAELCARLLEHAAIHDRETSPYSPEQAAWAADLRDAAALIQAAPVVERADSATPVVERDAGNLSDNAAPVAPAANAPHIADGYSARPYGDGYIIHHESGGAWAADLAMVAAVREIERLRAALAAPAVPPQKPLHIEALNDAWEDRDRDYVRCFHSFAAGVSVAERAHGILLAAAPTAELIPGTQEVRHVVEHGHACIAPRRVESPQAGAVAAHQARAGCERDDRA